MMLLLISKYALNKMKLEKTLYCLKWFSLLAKKLVKL